MRELLTHIEISQSMKLILDMVFEYWSVWLSSLIFRYQIFVYFDHLFLSIKLSKSDVNFLGFLNAKK